MADQLTSEPGAVAAGALDTPHLDRAVSDTPLLELEQSSRGGGNAAAAEPTALDVQGDGHVNVLVGVDANNHRATHQSGISLCHRRNHLSFQIEYGWRGSAAGSLTRKAAAYGVGQGCQRTGPAQSGGSLSWPVHDTKTGSASAMVGDGRVGAGCVVYRWS
jgi:hypothetical protein